MPTLRFKAPEHHQLEEGDQIIPGGQTFEVSAKRAKELLADPHVDVSKADGAKNKPEAAGEGQSTDSDTKENS